MPPLASFIAPLSIQVGRTSLLRLTPVQTRVVRSVRNKRQSPQCNAALANNLAQTARVVMAAFQLSSLVTLRAVQPLYTPETFALITSGAVGQLQAVGFVQLAAVCAVQSAHDDTRQCNSTNVVTMAATALVYVIFRVKPPYVNVPFVATLLGLAALNLYAWFRADDVRGKNLNEESLVFQAAQIVKGVGGVAALCVAAGVGAAPSAVSTVYLFQVALNLLVSGVLSVRFGSSFVAADAILLAGATACLMVSNAGVAGVIGSAALLSATVALQRTVARGE